MNIFISYARKDGKPFAQQLKEAISSVPDIDVWMDDALEEGDLDWSVQLQYQINACELVLILLSPDVTREEQLNKQKSSFVLKEIHFAIQQNKAIVPVLIEETTIPLLLSGMQYIDLATNSDDAIARLLEIIRERAEKIRQVFLRQEMLVPNIAVHDEIKITGIEFGEGIQIESIPHDDLITLAPDAELPKKFVASIGREAFAIKTLFSDEEFSELAPKHKFYCPREIRVHGRRSQLGTHLALYVIADQVYFQGYARTIPNEKVSSVRCGIGRGGISDFVDRHGNFQDRNDFVVGNGLGAMVAIVAVEFADDAPIGRSPYVIVVRKGIRYPDDIWLSNKTNKPITSADNDDISRARFVFQSRQLDFGSTDIYAADFNGSNMVNLTDDNPEAYDGFFDDNGDEIVAWINNNTIRYSSMRDGQREVIEKVDPGAATQGTK